MVFQLLFSITCKIEVLYPEHFPPALRSSQIFWQFLHNLLKKSPDRCLQANNSSPVHDSIYLPPFNCLHVFSEHKRSIR